MGAKEIVITRSAKNRVGPTSVEARAMIFQWGTRPPSRSRCRWAFSTITIAASTIAPMAIAMPPSDMMLAPTPWKYMTMKAISTASGRVITATSAERRCSRKTTHTSATIAISSTSFSRRVATEFSISTVRS